MIPWYWAIAATICIIAAVRIPYSHSRQRARLDVEWIPKLREPTATRKLRLQYAARRLMLIGTALVFLGFCVSWLVMAGMYSGFLSWVSEVAKQ